MKQRLISIAAAALMVLALTPSAFASDVSNYAEKRIRRLTQKYTGYA